MKITDLRIGDKIMVGSSTHRVIGLHINGDVEVNAVDESGRYKHYYAVEVELCQPRYKLPEWKQDEDCDTLFVRVENTLCTIEYWIDNFQVGIQLHLCREIGEIQHTNMLGDEYPSIEDAQRAAEKHYNELVSELIETLTNTHNQ